MTRHCEKHDIDYQVETFSSFGLSLTSGTCPLCDSEQAEKEKKESEEKEQAANLAKMKSCNIEPMYYESTLDTYTVTTPEQELAKKTIAKMIETRKGKIVMLGKHGTGKTHLAVSVVKELGGKIYSMYEISTMIRQSYSSRATRDELEIVDELATLPMLAIDEIGRTKGSDAETNWLSYIIDKRHVRGLPLILISNKHVKKSCQDNGCPNCLENYISEDIMSRLNEDGLVLNFYGNDYRIEKRRTA